MNYRKEENRKNFGFIMFCLLMGVGIAAFGGVHHAQLKNQQVLVSREIDKVEKSIEHSRYTIRSTEMRMDQLLNRFVIRQQLEQNKSTLKPISLAVVEEIDPARMMQRNMAVVADTK